MVNLLPRYWIAVTCWWQSFPALASAIQIEPPEDSKMVAEKVWSVPGSFVASAVNKPTSLVYALGEDGKVLLLTREGKEVASFNIELSNWDKVDTIRLANLAGDNAPELVTFGHWGRGVCAYDQGGRRLWRYEITEAVDDVWIANIDKDEDSREEIIVSYNGRGGLHVLDADSKLRWKQDDLTNQWHVTSRRDGEGNAFILGVSTEGFVRSYDMAGKKRTDIPVQMRPSLVRIASVGAVDAQVLVTADAICQRVAAFDCSGKPLWNVPLWPHGESNLLDGIVAWEKPWIAITMSDVPVCVFDVNTGEKLVSIRSGHEPTASWVPSSLDAPPLLVTTDAAGVVAYVLKNRPAAISK